MRSKERSIKLVTSPLAKMVLCFRVKLIKKTRRPLHLVGLFILEGLFLQGDERDYLPVSLNSAHFKSSKVGAGQEV